ncbi:MAG: STAS domain-containing protein [Streptosporangiaceae bacterium]|jgi:anti-anti-sigma factor
MLSADLSVVHADDQVTIVLTGDFDITAMPYLSARLAAVRAARPGRLVFDLTGVAFMDCRSVRLVVGAAGAGADGDVGGPTVNDTGPVLIGPPPVVRRLLRITGLDRACEIRDPAGPSHQSSKLTVKC